MRFTLVDRITSLDAGKSITAIKNLSLAEEYLRDHFPGFPVLPGVLMLESLVQAGAWLMRYTEDFRYSVVLLKEARAVRFKSFVVPGESLVLSVTVQKRDEGEYTLKGNGRVGEREVVSAKLVLKQFNLSDGNPDLMESDRVRTTRMRELFSELWTTPNSLQPGSTGTSE